MNKKFTKKGYSGEKKESIVPQKKKNLKRAVITVVAVFATLGILCGVLYGISEWLSKGKAETYGETPATLDGKSYINYYEPDYSANIFEDEDYLEKDTFIRYVKPTSNGEMSTVIGYFSSMVLTEGQKFFIDYFDRVINGDYEAYHGMFAKEYLDNPDGFEKNPADRKFPMQRIYDIKIKELGRTDPGDTSYNYNGVPAVFGVYEVSYKILKNDGQFRYDLPEGGEKALIFELVTTGAGTDDECTLIKDIYSYADIALR